jgi:hypothetical protein
MFAPRGWLKRPSARRVYKQIRDSGLFDQKWYAKELGVTSLFYDPLWHYLDVGARLGRNPSQHFDTRHYTSTYPDVGMADINPLFHFVAYGRAEGRLGIRSLPQAFAHLYPHLEELPTFVSPHSGLPRLTTVIDDATLARKDLSLADVIEQSLKLAKRDKRFLRFISRASDARSVEAALAGTDFGATPIDVVSQRAGGKPTHFAVHDGEQFLATSWTSLAALRFTAKPSNVAYIPAHQGAKKGSVASLASGETWRAWALANELPENNRPAELGGKPVAVAGAIARIVVLADQSATPLSALLTLRELEKLQVSLASQGLALEITVAGIDLGPLELIGGVVKALSPSELATTAQAFDFALDLGAGTALRASLDAKGTPTISVSHSALVDEGKLASTLRELLQFSEVSR